jgi:hypothetical protein
VHLDDVGRAGPLVQPVDVLGHDRYEAAGLIEVDKSTVPGIGLGRPRGVRTTCLPRAASYVGVGEVVLQRRHPLGRWITSPHAIRTAKVRDSRVRRDARTREHRDLLCLTHPLLNIRPGGSHEASVCVPLLHQIDTDGVIRERACNHRDLEAVTLVNQQGLLPLDGAR